MNSKYLAHGNAISCKVTRGLSMLNRILICVLVGMAGGWIAATMANLAGAQ